MKFVTLKTNPPEKVAAIIGRKGSVFSHGYSYHLVDFCPLESSVDNVINELQSHSMTHWKFLEDEDNEPMTSGQYEAEANADHLTSEQFPNV